MLINLRFFAYDDSSRHTSHRLYADVKVNSLAGFNYGERIVLTEQIEGSTAKNYIIADLPFRKNRTVFLTGNVQAFDVYLAPEAKWDEFNPPFSPKDSPYGPTL